MKNKIIKAIKIVLIVIGTLFLLSPVILGVVTGILTYRPPPEYGPRTKNMDQEPEENSVMLCQMKMWRQPA